MLIRSSALALAQPYLRWLCFFVRTSRQDDVRRLAGACRLIISTATSSGIFFTSYIITDSHLTRGLSFLGLSRTAQRACRSRLVHGSEDTHETPMFAMLCWMADHSRAMASICRGEWLWMAPPSASERHQTTSSSVDLSGSRELTVHPAWPRKRASVHDRQQQRRGPAYGRVPGAPPGAAVPAGARRAPDGAGARARAAGARIGGQWHRRSRGAAGADLASADRLVSVVENADKRHHTQISSQQCIESFSRLAATVESMQSRPATTLVRK